MQILKILLLNHGFHSLETLFAGRTDHVQLASLFKINLLLALDTKCQCGSLVEDLNHIV